MCYDLSRNINWKKNHLLFDIINQYTTLMSASEWVILHRNLQFFSELNKTELVITNILKTLGKGFEKLTGYSEKLIKFELIRNSKLECTLCAEGSTTILQLRHQGWTTQKQYVRRYKLHWKMYNRIQITKKFIQR